MINNNRCYSAIRVVLIFLFAASSSYLFGSSNYELNKKVCSDSISKNDIIKYYKSIEYNPNDSIISYVNRYINLEPIVSNKILKAYTAFEYFKDPNIMGQEAVAISVANNYFLNNKYELSSPDDLFIIKTYVDLNKSSLIGMSAPNLAMYDTCDVKHDILNNDRRFTIIYFYTPECSVCKITTPTLVSLLNLYKGVELNICAIYAEDNKELWKKYINKHFKITNPKIHFYNYYDPLVESRFHILYNVISTPSMYLLDRSNKIIGRSLNTSSLMELLTINNNQIKQLDIFFSDFFSKDKIKDKKDLFKSIDSLWEKSKENLEIQKDLMLEVYSFLKESNSKINMKGANYIIKKYL